MANHRAQVDEMWLDSGQSIELEGEYFPVIPPEETLWTKLYVLQRDRNVLDGDQANQVTERLSPRVVRIGATLRFR